MDWLPWSHPFGGTHNRNMVLLYSDQANRGMTAMSVYTLGEKSITLASTTALPTYASLHLARQGKVLLQTWSGLLLFDINQPQAPFAQSYFAASSWGGGITVVGDTAYVPAYSAGIYQFKLSDANLTKP